MKKLSIVFSILAVLLSDIMCAHIAYAYCDMKWATEYYLTSAPAWVVFIFAIPYLVGIAVCVLCSVYFFHRSEKEI